MPVTPGSRPSSRASLSVGLRGEPVVLPMTSEHRVPSLWYQCVPESWGWGWETVIGSKWHVFFHFILSMWRFRWGRRRVPFVALLDLLLDPIRQRLKHAVL